MRKHEFMNHLDSYTLSHFDLIQSYIQFQIRPLCIQRLKNILSHQGTAHFCFETDL